MRAFVSNGRSRLRVRKGPLEFGPGLEQQRCPFRYRTVALPAFRGCAISVQRRERDMLAIRLPEEIEGRLERLAKATGRTKTFYAPRSHSGASRGSGRPVSGRAAADRQPGRAVADLYAGRSGTRARSGGLTPVPRMRQRVLVVRGGRRREIYRGNPLGLRRICGQAPSRHPRPERSGEPGSISLPRSKPSRLRLGPGSGSGATNETRGRELSSERRSFQT